MAISRRLRRHSPDSADATQRHRVEHLLAVWRLLLAAVALAAIQIDPTEPSRFAPVCYALAAIYVIASALVWLMLQVHPSLVVRGAAALLLMDILLPSVLIALSGGASSPFFLLLTFAVISAAYRWGLIETLGSSLLALTLLLAGVALTSETRLLDSATEANGLIVRCGYLLLLSVGVGIIAERERSRRAESAMLARALARARPEYGLRAALGGAAREILETFRMTTALVALREVESGRAFLWRARAAPGTAHTQTDVTELDPDRSRLYLFDLGSAADTWCARRQKAGSTLEFLAIDRDRQLVKELSLGIPEDLSAQYAWRTMLCSRIGVGDEWMGRVLLLSDHSRRPAEHQLAFLQRLCRHLEPSLYSVYLVGRLRSRVGAVERARISRELHDGVIQSLFSTQVRLETLRRRINPGLDAVSLESLDIIQQQLHVEVQSLRDLMQQLEPPDIRSGRVLELLAQRVERFSRDTGIRARFLSDLTDLRLPPRLCQELTRIVQEALVNIRKHSRASNAVVQFEQLGGCWRLVVEDDGQGFAFEGRLDERELTARRAGPVVIRERVRTIGGTMAVESERGRGARLEIMVPQDRAHTPAAPLQ